MSSEIIRAVRKIAQLIPSGSAVTVEATPLYAGKKWDETHEVGFNGILPLQVEALQDRGCRPVHIAMVDDYTTGQSADSDHFTHKMKNRPERVRFESEFAQQAEDRLARLRSARRVTAYNGELHLTDGSRPRLTVRSGRVSCELLDACFQETKGEGTHIIIHPTNFIHQQEGMRDVLSAMRGRLPGNIINIFFRRTNLSRVLFTDVSGRTTHV